VVDQDSTTLTVNAVQDAVLDSAITNEGQAVTIQVLGNDSYEDSSALITAVNGQAIATGQSVSVANGTVTLNSDGTLSFAPSSGYSNTAETPTTFTYTVTAGGKTEAAMVAVQVTPAADLALSANGYWTFDNSTTTGITTTTANEQATTQIGTLSGDARIGAGTHDGNALVLSSSDGSNDFLALDSTVTSALVGGAASSQATLAFWINTTQRGSSNGYSSPSVIGNSASGNNDIQWGWLNSSGQIGIARGSANTSVSDTVVADGTWHQVTIGYDFDAEVAKIYVDGVLEYSGDLLADSVVTQLAGLGVTSGQSGALSTYLNGQLDDVRIYDRVLTDAEVSAIYVSESLTTAAGAVTVDSVSSDGSVQFAIDGGLHASISLSGAPAGAVLSDGNGHSLTLTGGSGVISNPSAWNLDQLKLSNLGGMSALLSIESTQTGGTLANSTLNIVAAHHATASNGRHRYGRLCLVPRRCGLRPGSGLRSRASRQCRRRCTGLAGPAQRRNRSQSGELPLLRDIRILHRAAHQHPGPVRQWQLRCQQGERNHHPVGDFAGQRSRAGICCNRCSVDRQDAGSGQVAGGQRMMLQPGGQPAPPLTQTNQGAPRGPFFHMP
jgi:hypothetical protein